MTTDVSDLRSTIIPRSDQINSDQLLGGPMIIVVTEVEVGSSKEQPVTIHYEGENGRPYKPCLTMRKVLVLAWGPDGTTWPGRSIEIYNDPSVKFGGEIVGGIRISRLSDIPKQINVSLTATKGRKAMHEIKPLSASPELTACLAAITAATNGEGMKKAKALAELLTSDADIAFARSAYSKKVAQLKAKPAAPVIPDEPEDAGSVIDPADRPDAGAEAEPPRQGTQRAQGKAKGEKAGPSYAQLADRLHASSDKDVADLILDEARGLPPEQQQDLERLHAEKFPE